MELITLNKRLRFFNINCHDENVINHEVTEAVKKERKRPGQLMGYCAMYHNVRQVHGLNVKRYQVCAAMTDADPAGIKTRKRILKKKKTKGTCSSVGPS